MTPASSLKPPSSSIRATTPSRARSRIWSGTSPPSAAGKLNIDGIAEVFGCPLGPVNEQSRRQRVRFHAGGRNHGAGGHAFHRQARSRVEDMAVRFSIHDRVIFVIAGS